jgi:AsmA-like C-terminal region
LESPLYTGAGTFEQIALSQLASAMHDPWLTGSGGGEYRVETHGHTLPELLGTAAASLKFDIHGGELSHLVADEGSLQFRRFTGMLLLRNGIFEVQHGSLDSAAGNYSLSGSASWARQLNFTLVSNGAPKIAVSGTLASPVISTSPVPSARVTLPR